MATYSSFKFGGTTGAPGAFTNRNDGYLVMQFDIAKFVATNAYVKTDVEQLISIPARTRFFLDAVYIDTAFSAGTTPTISIGDSAAGTTFVNAQTASGAANTSIATIATTAKTYDAADTITVTLNNASGTVVSGKFTIVARLVDCSVNPVARATPSV